MASCQYGTEGCRHAGKEHDEECCWTGKRKGTYICQECGHTQEVEVFSLDFKGWPPRKCPKGCDRRNSSCYSFIA